MQEQIFQQFSELIASQNEEKALILIEDSLKTDLQNADLIGLKGVALFHLRDLSCMQWLDKAVLMEPENPYRYSSRAYVKDALGDTEDAIKDYTIATKLDPLDMVAHNNLGLLEEKLGRKNQSLQHFTTADELAGVPPKPAYSFPHQITDDSLNPKSKLKNIFEIFSSAKGWSEFFTFVKGRFKKN